MTREELHRAASHITASLIRVVPVANAKGGPYQASAQIYFDALAALEAEAKKRFPDMGKQGSVVVQSEWGKS